VILKKKISYCVITANYYLASSLLLFAGIVKLIEPSNGEILEILLEKRILSFEGLILISKIQPWAEICLGLFALSGWKANVMAKLLSIIYLFFGGLILYASEGYLTLPLDCGCFGEGDGTAVYVLLLRNIILSALLFSFNIQNRRSTPYYVFTRPPIFKNKELDLKSAHHLF